MKKYVWLLIPFFLVGFLYFSFYRNSMIDMDHASTGHEMGVVENDKDFISKMIPHHEEAIETSKILIGKGEYDDDFKIFLEAVVQVQSEEVEKMKIWYKEWFGDEYESDGTYQNMMPGNLENLSIDDAKTAYIDGMIAHHNGAIEMAKQVLKVTTRKEINDMATDIIAVQSEEVEMLKGWR